MGGRAGHPTRRCKASQVPGMPGYLPARTSTPAGEVPVRSSLSLRLAVWPSGGFWPARGWLPSGNTPGAGGTIARCPPDGSLENSPGEQGTEY